MKRKLLFIKMCWKVIKGKKAGWIFFSVTEQQQLNFLNDVEDANINFKYINIDKRFIEKFVEKIEK